MTSGITPPGSGRSSENRRWARTAAGAPVVLSQVESDSFAAEQYRNLAFQVEQRKRELGDDALVVAMSSSDPGAGKTLTALNLALTLTREGERRVLLVEGDLWKPTMSDYLEIEESTPGLAQVLAGESTMDDAVSTVWGTELDVLWAGQLVRTTGLMAQRRLERAIAEMRSAYEIVVIDSPPVMLASGRTLADAADSVLVLVRSGQTKRRGIEEALSVLPREKVLGFVLNGARRTSEKGYAYYAGYSRATERAHGGDRGRKRWWKIGGAAATALVSVAAALWLFRAAPEEPPAVAEALEELEELASATPSAASAPETSTGPTGYLLEGARDAARTVEAYDVSYVQLAYPGGDPGLERGNAADLVVRAFRSAGLDLQQEVHEDLLADPAAYGALEPDSNVDHRRVRYLMTWFDRHGTSLDVGPEAGWQAGDVVFWATDRPNWPNHVGIVSDSIAESGRPMVIHHFKADSTGSEADVLTRWPIVGHFRWTAPPGG